MKLVAYNDATGKLHIVTPAYGKVPDMSDDQLLDLVKDKDVPGDAVGVRVIDHTEVPTDRTFREAWKDTGSSVEVDMDKARPIHLDRLRAIRNRKLKDLDAEYLRADEANDGQGKRRIARKKQALRDLSFTRSKS